MWFILGDDVRQKDGGVSRDCCIGNFFSDLFELTLSPR